MLANIKYRSNAPEIMDDFGVQGEPLRDALDKIAKINRLLGGNKVTLQGVKAFIETIPKSEEITIMDFGCGNGDMLRMIAEFGSANGRMFKLVGIDANNFAISIARKLSESYEIEYRCEDIFGKSFNEPICDISLCTLTLHHFNDDEIADLLNRLFRRSKFGIVINDLHRHKLAYLAFQLLCLIFGLREMPKKDGLLSIKKGFKRQELIDFSKKLNFKNYNIQWKWAFRYQWIISKS